jgi:hypothetical protein
MVIRPLKLSKTPNLNIPIIKGIDMQRFNRVSVDEKAKMIPTKYFEEIKLGAYTMIFSDDH